MDLLIFTIIFVVGGIALSKFDEYKKNISNNKQKVEFENILERAKQGDREMQFRVAINYLSHNDIIDNDEKKASYWLEKAADQGEVRAQVMLAEKYSNGSGVEQSDIKAAYWYEKAAEQEDIEAQYNLAQMYFKGIGIEQSNIKAIRWIESAANNDHAQAQFELGIFLSEGDFIEKNLTQAFKCINKAAQKGVVDAQLRLAIMYFKGVGNPKDETKAAEWLIKAAKKKNIEAQYLIGCCYIKGIGVEKNNYSAASWLSKASAQGYDKAQAELGFLYLTGDGGIQNNYKAFEFLFKAAKQGVSEAQRQISLMYYEGLGVEKDIYEANKWLGRFNENKDSYHKSENKNGELEDFKVENIKSEDDRGNVVNKKLKLDDPNYLYPDQANELLKNASKKPSSLFVSIACRFDSKDKVFKTIGYSASFKSFINEEEIDSSLEDITIVPSDERFEHWFDDGISLVDLHNTEDFSAFFQFDKNKWQGEKGKAIENIIILDDFIYNIEKMGLPLVVFGFGIKIINDWIVLSMKENGFSPKSSHFNNCMSFSKFKL